jgi:hypothetical protein
MLLFLELLEEIDFPGRGHQGYFRVKSIPDEFSR